MATAEEIQSMPEYQTWNATQKMHALKQADDWQAIETHMSAQKNRAAYEESLKKPQPVQKSELQGFLDVPIEAAKGVYSGVKSDIGELGETLTDPFGSNTSVAGYNIPNVVFYLAGHMPISSTAVQAAKMGDAAYNKFKEGRSSGQGNVEAALRATPIVGDIGGDVSGALTSAYEMGRGVPKTNPGAIGRSLFHLLTAATPSLVERAAVTPLAASAKNWLQKSRYGNVARVLGATTKEYEEALNPTNTESVYGKVIENVADELPISRSAQSLHKKLKDIVERKTKILKPQEESLFADARAEGIPGDVDPGINALLEAKSGQMANPYARGATTEVPLSTGAGATIRAFENEIGNLEAMKRLKKPTTVDPEDYLFPSDVPTNPTLPAKISLEDMKRVITSLGEQSDFDRFNTPELSNQALAARTARFPLKEKYYETAGELGYPEIKGLNEDLSNWLRAKSLQGEGLEIPRGFMGSMANAPFIRNILGSTGYGVRTGAGQLLSRGFGSTAWDTFSNQAKLAMLQSDPALLSALLGTGMEEEYAQ